MLLEVSPKPGGQQRPGPSDLWMSRRDGGGWRLPDGCDLIFVRDFSAFYRVALGAAIGAVQSP